MYLNQIISVADFAQQLKTGKALPTGSASPYKINESVVTALQSAKDGLEAELISVSASIRGGLWQSDTDKSQNGYIGNFQCILRIGAHQTPANLSVADAVQFMLGNGKAVVGITTSPNKKDESKPYVNLRCKSVVACDFVNNKEHIAALDAIVEMATEPVTA